jgi:hypothetical protein
MQTQATRAVPQRPLVPAMTRWVRSTNAAPAGSDSSRVAQDAADGSRAAAARSFVKALGHTEPLIQAAHPWEGMPGYDFSDEGPSGD